jgi:tetratricopeptide (TPR) repeat protein
MMKWKTSQRMFNVQKRRRIMSSSKKKAMTAIFLVGCLTAFATTAFAQSSQGGQPTQGQPGQQPNANKDQKPGDTGSSLEIPTNQPPVNAEEDAAAKAFQAMPNTELPKKIAAGEDFLKKYPESRYRPMIYSALVFEYIQTNNLDKAFDIGDKEVALKPDDAQTMAVLSQTIPRAMNASTQEPQKRLAKAETYAKRAIEITPTLPKPEGMPDQNFVTAKNETLTMAHSGLGLVYLREGKYNDAIPELEQSLKIDPNPAPDPVNLYLLGMANVKASHFDEAAIAFNKCAALPGSLQNTCKNGAEEAKKQGATQLSAPK